LQTRKSASYTRDSLICNFYLQELIAKENQCLVHLEAKLNK